MKKLLILLLLISFGAEAQYSSRSRDRRLKGNTQKAVSFDGATQYLSKTTPVSMDLNGSELLSNPTFDVNITGWATFTTGATVAQETNGNRVRTGAGSARIITQTPPATNTGMRYNSIITNATTNKYTLEGWAYMPASDSSKKVNLRIRDQANSILFTSSTVTLTADTWTKLVLNFQLPGTQTGFYPIFQLVEGGNLDTLYIDDVSLTQAYDAMVVMNFKTAIQSTFASNQRLFYNRTGTTGYSLTGSSGNNYMLCLVGDGTTTAANTIFGNQNACNGKYNTVIFTINRTGNITQYLNGNTDGGAASATLVGKVMSPTTFYLGYDGSSVFYNGSYGDIQVVTFTALPSDIASIVASISATKKPLSSYTNGTIVGWWDFKNGFNDKVGLNNLTPTGAPPIIQVKY
jgi:hypothetical protein